MSPEEIIAYQNEVFSFMIDIISKHHGNINQFMGDGFMATFGAPVSHGNDALNAIQASLAIYQALAKWNEDHLDLTTDIGIGLDYGEAVMGNVGNAERKQFSITGHVVITASRIEQQTKRRFLNKL